MRRPSISLLFIFALAPLACAGWLGLQMQQQCVETLIEHEETDLRDEARNSALRIQDRLSDVDYLLLDWATDVKAVREQQQQGRVAERSPQQHVQDEQESLKELLRNNPRTNVVEAWYVSVKDPSSNWGLSVHDWKRFWDRKVDRTYDKFRAKLTAVDFDLQTAAEPAFPKTAFALQFLEGDSRLPVAVKGYWLAATEEWLFLLIDFREDLAAVTGSPRHVGLFFDANGRPLLLPSKAEEKELHRASVADLIDSQRWRDSLRAFGKTGGNDSNAINETGILALKPEHPLYSTFQHWYSVGYAKPTAADWQDKRNQISEAWWDYAAEHPVNISDLRFDSYDKDARFVISAQSEADLNELIRRATKAGYRLSTPDHTEKFWLTYAAVSVVPPRIRKETDQTSIALADGQYIGLLRACSDKENRADVMARIWLVYIGYIAICIFVVAGLAVLYYMIYVPLARLLKGASALQQANFVTVQGECWTSEFATLQDAFNDMSNELRKQTEELKDERNKLDAQVQEKTRDLTVRNAELVEKSEQLTATSSELASKNNEMELEKEKRELFLAQVNHDLRQPLTAIGGYADLLQELQKSLTKQQQEYQERWTPAQMDALNAAWHAATQGQDGELFRCFLQETSQALAAEQKACAELGQHLRPIQRGANRIRNLLDDLGDFQKYVQNKLKPDLTVFRLRELLDEAIEAQSLKAKSLGAELALEVADEIPLIYSDRRWLYRIVGNLLSNACKFTPNGTVWCRAKIEADPGSAGQQLVIEVQDTGRGMTPEEQALLFRPYQKIVSRDENPDGTGLGLVISRSFAQTLGGTVGVDPERTGLGKGSTFVVRLPLLSPADLPDVPNADKQSTGALRHDLALVIDDDPEVCHLLREFFERRRFEVLESHDGEEGLRLARERLPGIVTLDAQLPSLNGWQVLEKLKGNPITAAIRVVMITVFNQRKRGFALGADDYVNKPIDWQQLERIVSRFNHPEQKVKILVVDDDPDCRGLVRSKLAIRNWEVVEAADGVEGIERLKEQAFDLVLLDLVMPNMDGFEFTQRVKAADSPWKNIPIVVFTGQHLTDLEKDRFHGLVEQFSEKGSLKWLDFSYRVNDLIYQNQDSKTLAH